MKKFVLLKLIGMVILTMAGLVAISFFEVAVYSYILNPNQDQSVYEAHANATAPYISAIFGFIIFFLIGAVWKKNGVENGKQLSWWFPLTYFIMDIVIVSIAGIKWSDYLLIFMFSNLAKFIGSLSGFNLTKKTV